MKAIALLLVLALPAFAAAPDAPLAVVVDGGTFLPYPLDVDTANRLQDAESRPTKAALASVVVAAVAVAAACFGAGVAVGKKK